MEQNKNSNSLINGKNYANKIQKFNNRWNITSSGLVDYPKFKNRILTIVDTTVGDYILGNSQVSTKYAILIGDFQSPKVRSGEIDFDEVFGKEFQNTSVYNNLHNSKNLQTLIAAIQSIFWVLSDFDCPLIDNLIDGIQSAIDLSPGVSLRIVKNKNNVTIYPGGVKLLDDKLVNETLSWLENKPLVAKNYEQALSIYMSKDESKFRNLLDNLRIALEQLLRAILRNKKSLENQKPLLLSWLKNKGIHNQIINMYFDLLSKYTEYQNDAVKHDEKWTYLEIEFMIYLTGTFMRLLLELDRQVQQVQK